MVPQAVYIVVEVLSIPPYSSLISSFAEAFYVYHRAFSFYFKHYLHWILARICLFNARYELVLFSSFNIKYFLPDGFAKPLTTLMYYSK
jgi:hypothetical protein